MITYGQITVRGNIVLDSRLCAYLATVHVRRIDSEDPHEGPDYKVELIEVDDFTITVYDGAEADLGDYGMAEAPKPDHDFWLLMIERRERALIHGRKLDDVNFELADYPRD